MAESTQKTCRTCGQLKPLVGFYRDAKRRDGLFSECKDCIRGLEQVRRDNAISEGDKLCRMCGQLKPVAEFPISGKSPDGRNFECRLCRNARTRAGHCRNREARLAYGKKWRSENRDLARELTRAWTAANADQVAARVKAYRKANAGRLKEARQRWLEANPDYYRKWTAENIEGVRASSRKWTRDHPDANAELSRRRRARERGLTVGPVDLDALWTGECALCGHLIDAALRWPDPLSKSIDHIVPIARGGPHAQENLAWAHLVCNMRKGDRLN